jgi:hypothetical protein
MKMILWIAFGAIVLALLVLVTNSIVQSKHRPHYTVIVANRTKEDLQGVAVFYGKQMITCPNFLVKSGRAGEGIITTPPPEEAIVCWTIKGVNHAPKVKLSGIVSPVPQHVNIWFVIEEDGSVTVKEIRDDDLDADLKAF